MQLSTALKRIGAVLVKDKAGKDSKTLLLRVDPERGDLWVAAITSFLVASSGKPFSADISKYFYAQNGAIKYLWRIVISGEVEAALSLFGSCAIEAAMAGTRELESFPLVGRVRYPFDLASGKLKGAHDVAQAQTIVSMAVSGVTGGAS